MFLFGYLALSDKFTLVYKIVGGVFSDCTPSPQYKTDLAIAYSHGGNWDDVCEYEVDNVIAVKSKN